MENRRSLIFLIVIVGLLFCCLPVTAQFTPEETSQFEKWEVFLKTADISSPVQMKSREAVTQPWVLTLTKDGVTRKAIWKNVRGRKKGFVEGWQWELAAYKLDRMLGLNMVPPTVERRFQGDRGSLQLWIENTFTLKHKVEKKIKTPSYKVVHWNKALFLQRAFDNLIANVDRHQNQYLITEDFRMILIDYTRSFRSSKKFTKKLIYDEKYKEGSRLMKRLPRDFYEKVKALTFDSIRLAIEEDYLTDKEIQAVLLRRDLIVKWIDKRCAKLGEDKVLYEAKKVPKVY